MRIFLILLLFIGIKSYAQTNEEIASIYIKKTEANLESLKFEEALSNYNKAIKLLDTITKPKVARLGMLINYEMANYNDSKKFAKQYFTLQNNKTSEEYMSSLELYVELEEKITAIEEEKKHQEKLRLAREKELKRIDSLKKVWANKADALSFEADSIYAFNKNNSAVFAIKNKYGVVNNKGKILVKPNYGYFLDYDGYIVFTDKKEEPKSVYVFNSNTSALQKVLPIMDFNGNSTHYGKVTLPRGNGRLVMYPNNSTKTLVFDIETNKNVRIADIKNLLKSLKKNDKIDKYDDDERTVRVHKEWYSFGSHLGEGVYTLYTTESKKLYGYLITKTDAEDPVVVKATTYKNLGVFYNGKAQAVKDGKIVWVNKTCSEVSAPKNEKGVYTGDIKATKLKEGKYQFKQNGFIVKGDEKLGKIADFLRENSPEKDGTKSEETK